MFLVPTPCSRNGSEQNKAMYGDKKLLIPKPRCAEFIRERQETDQMEANKFALGVEVLYG